MAHKQQKMEVVPPAEEPEEMPLPSDPKVIFLGGLFALALLAAVYVAAEIVLPLVIALVLTLLLQPSPVESPAAISAEVCAGTGSETPTEPSRRGLNARKRVRSGMITPMSAASA
jgi:hypothetical protein